MIRILLTMLLSLLIPFGAMAQEAYAVFTDDGTLTFYYDKQKSSRSGTKYGMNDVYSEPGWYTEHRTDITRAVFDSSFSGARPTSTYKWFAVDFGEVSNLTEFVGLEFLNTSEVTNMSFMFSHCYKQISIDLSHFDTSKVTNMSGMFDGCSGLTTLDLTPLNTSNVTNMSVMFQGCSGLPTLDLTPLNTSNVTNMAGMFQNCKGLTSLDLTPLNTSKVTNMSNMFCNCSGLTSLDLTPLNTSNVTNMYCMFAGCKGLIAFDLTPLNTINVTNIGFIFSGCSGLTALDLTPLNTSKVTNMSGMFADCSGLTALDLTPLNTSNVTNMNSMFSGCGGLTSLDLRPLNTDKVTNIGYIFSGCSGLTTLDLTPLNTSKVTNMSNMFCNCSGLTSLDLTPLSTDNVTDMSRMFYGCGGLTSLDLRPLNTDKVTNIGYIFSGCSGLTALDLTPLSTDNVTDMICMFQRCSSLTSLDLTSLNTSNVMIMYGMFQNCSGLTTLDLTSFNIINVSDMSFMFSGCSGLNTIYVDENWNTESLTSSKYMFENCTKLVGGAGTIYDSNHVDVAYAHVDGGPSNPGYFTDKNASVTVCDADDMMKYVLQHDSDGNAIEVPLCDEPTIDGDVDVDDIQIFIDGTDQDPQPVIGFYGGYINIKQNAGMSFKSVTFASKDVTAVSQRASGSDGGIRNSGMLTFENCTFQQGSYTIENSGVANLGSGVIGCNIINKYGGRIQITSPLTSELTITIPTAEDVEPGVAIITGISSADNITLSVPSGYAWKYDETAGGIVVYSTAGITVIEQQQVVESIYDASGRKVKGQQAKGLTIQRMSDGTVKKTIKEYR